MIDFRLPTALFGGSFDPVHLGHLQVAKEVRKQMPQIQQLVFVPAAQSPGKQPVGASAEQRLKWLKLAVEPEGFLVWEADLDRGGESFTVETLGEAHKQSAAYERLYWILGADAYASFGRWREPERIRELCRLVVVNRPGQKINMRESSDLLLEIPPHPASSSEIRAQLASGDTSSPWIPDAVRSDMEKILPLHNPYVRKR